VKLLKTLLAAACAAMLIAGCKSGNYATEERADKGLVVILPGIEGPSIYNESIRKGLYEGGVPFELEIYDWHPHEAGLWYLFNEPAARRRAAEAAAHVADYMQAHPGEPVFIVGHSAGAGIAVFAAEVLGPSRRIDGIVLMGASLSPTYDLTKALEVSNYRMVSCSGSTDLFIWWMSVAAHNIDGTKGRAAGQEGFRLPKDATPERREAFLHLEQIRWSPTMITKGNLGGHTGWASSHWVAANIAPIISR